MRLIDRFPLPARIAGGYAAIASLWIVLSDAVVAWISGNPERAWLADSSKGLVFVVVTALVLHAVLRRMIARFEATEAALRASDARWKFALEGAGDGVWDWDGESGKTFYSPCWKAILGYAESELDDRFEEWESRIHPDDRARVREQFELHYAGKTPAYVCEHRMRTKDGSYKWVLSRGRVVSRAPDGRPLRAIGTHTDITARKDAEARIVDALNFNEAILRSTPVGIITYRADGQTVSANEAAARFVGAEVSVLLKQNFRQLESWRRHGLVELADRALRGNTVIFQTMKIVTSAGRVTWGELSFAPFYYQGEQRLLLIANDVTQHRAVNERMNLLHAALEAAPVGWIVTDAAGVVEWVNPGFTRLTGYAPDEIIGRKAGMLESDRPDPGFGTDIWQTVREGRIWQGEVRSRHKSGALYHERMTVAPVRDAEGAIAHFVAMQEDVTGRHELEQQLARSQRLESIGLLASGVAHDLNNILAPIMLSVGLIKSLHRDRETHDLLDMMQGSAQRGASVVQQMLTFARGVDGERARLDVRPLVKELAELARETFPREIRIAVETPASALWVVGGVTQVHQVLLNLAVNARDAMPEGGVLTLKACTVVLDEAAARAAPGGKAGPYIKLIVADTGSGIPPDVLEHIFEPFFTTKPRGKGTGLGLSTVYGIVRSHGGFVDVRSTPGKGTEFSVLLPASASPEVVASVQAPVARPIVGAGRRVLVVDDEIAIRRVTQRVLQQCGLVAVEAEDGLQGLAQLRDHPASFCAAIVDLMMPGMNGHKLIAEMRRLAPSLPIIVASGMMGETDAGQNGAALTALGVRAMLKKPFGEAELLLALEAGMKADA